LIAASWSAETSPPEQDATGELRGHRKTEISTLSYQSSFIFPICIWSSAAEPTKVSDTKVTRMTEMVIERFRRRPRPISDRMNCSRMPGSPQRAEP